MSNFGWILIPFLIAGCSSNGLKNRYSFSKDNKSYAEGNEVSMIKTSLRDKVLFASGVDSAPILVRLYDNEGNQLTSIDPLELAVSSDKEVKVTPFALKSGVYQADVGPLVNSEDVSLQVDWLGRTFGSVVTFKTTMAPLKNKLRPLKHKFEETKYIEDIGYRRGSVSPENITEAFSFSNQVRGNSYRNFSFQYLEQATQNLALVVDDAPNGTISHTMHSLFMFFPRKNLPFVEMTPESYEVTISTGEKIIFDRDSKLITGGVFKEGKINRSYSIRRRHFANLKYQGKGIILRANARGQSPQIGQYSRRRIDYRYGLKGAVDVLIINGTTGQRCRRPKKDFWRQRDVRPIQFKFATDREFDRYLRAKCGFGIPKV